MCCHVLQVSATCLQPIAACPKMLSHFTKMVQDAVTLGLGDISSHPVHALKFVLCLDRGPQPYTVQQSETL